jgi:hypothetical protein
MQEHYRLWKTEPGWNWTWMITDGLGEAGEDLEPNSDFLKQLNALPRRDGVQYTIVAGNQSPLRESTASCLDRTARLIPRRVERLWGFRQTKRKLCSSAENLRAKSDSDGPVGVSRCKLKGVDDFVVVAADHATLYCPPCDGQAPVAWAVIQDRLNR